MGGDIMAKSDLRITFEIEPIIKLSCVETLCRFNLAKQNGFLACNLKHINIGFGGTCQNKEIRTDPQDKPT
jgi:hypothetical protein